MTLFSRYVNQDKVLIKKSMSDLSELIKNESNKTEISELIYHRLYNRFLKIFFFSTTETEEYEIDGEKYSKNKFLYEYKNGFLMMSSSCLLIESLASYIQGNDRTIGNGNDNFKVVFNKCTKYSNDLKIFNNQNLYKSIRNGLLHQGESYDKYKIVREGVLFTEKTRTINAKKFVDNLSEFLNSYKNELINANWDDEIWDNCRRKIRYIIKNT